MQVNKEDYIKASELFNEMKEYVAEHTGDSFVYRDYAISYLLLKFSIILNKIEMLEKKSNGCNCNKEKL